MSGSFEGSGSFKDFARPDGIYMLNHSVGLPPSSIAHVADDLIARWLTQPHDAWPGWTSELDGFHAELGRLFNHDPQWFCHQVNVSSAVTKVIHSLPRDPSRSVIVLSERAFPSLGYVAQAASAAGYATRMLPADADTTDPAAWGDAVTDDVAVVMVGHAESNTGARLPVPEILELIRESGAISVVDVAQSAGVIPIDLRSWQADFVVGTAVKWLCGGPGAAFVWVNPDRIGECEPLDVGWFSHTDPFEFDINDFRFAPDARRFWGGTPSPIPAALARHGIAALNNIGVGTIHEHNTSLTERLINGVSAIDDGLLVSPREAPSRSGTVVIDPGSAARTTVLAALAAASVRVDERAQGIRISPHLINSIDDIDTVLTVLDRTCAQ